MAKKNDANKFGTGSYITAGILAGTLLIGVFTPIENIPVIGGMAESMGMNKGELGRSFVGLAGESFSMRSGTASNYNKEQEILKVNKTEYISQIDGFGVLGSFSWRGTPSSEDTLFPAKVQTSKRKQNELEAISELKFNTGNQKAFVLDNEKEANIDASAGIVIGSGRIGRDSGLSVYANKKDIKNRAMFMDSSVKSSPIFVNLGDKNKSGAKIATKKGDVFVDKETVGNIVNVVDGSSNTYGTFGQANIETSRVYAGKNIWNLGIAPFGQMGFSWLASRVADNAKRPETKATFSSAAFSGEKSSREVIIAKGGVSKVINLSGPNSADTLAKDTDWLLRTQEYFETCSTTIGVLADRMAGFRESIVNTLSQMKTLEGNYPCDDTDYNCIPYRGDDQNSDHHQGLNINGFANAKRVYWNARIPLLDITIGQENEQNLVPLCEKLKADYLLIEENCGFVYLEGTCDEEDLKILEYVIPPADYQVQICIDDCVGSSSTPSDFLKYDCLESCKVSIPDLSEEFYMNPAFTVTDLLGKLDIFFGRYEQTSVWTGGGDEFGSWAE